ncbi:hypothetical protein [Streptomyces sp. KL116D]|uniref:hypothetical protein n=1 Tax=Streptomyces sp. KL116D TaxID=3045152 RepID=UPI003558C151
MYEKTGKPAEMPKNRVLKYATVQAEKWGKEWKIVEVKPSATSLLIGTFSVALLHPATNRDFADVPLLDATHPTRSLPVKPAVKRPIGWHFPARVGEQASPQAALRK